MGDDIYEIVDMHKADAWYRQRDKLIGLQGWLENPQPFEVTDGSDDREWIGCIFHVTEAFEKAAREIRDDNKGTFNIYRILVKKVGENS